MEVESGLFTILGPVFRFYHEWLFLNFFSFFACFFGLTLLFFLKSDKEKYTDSDTFIVP